MDETHCPYCGAEEANWNGMNADAEWQDLMNKQDDEIARLRSDLAVEKINNKRLQSERNNAVAEIDRLQAEEANDARTIKSHADTIRGLQAAIKDLLSFIDDEDSDCVEAARKAIDWLEAEVTRLQAVLEKIVRNGDQGIHVPAPYDIAKEALVREEK